MIKSSDDYRYYLKCDEIARFGHNASFTEKLKMGWGWKFNVLLRKHEYYLNCKRGVLQKIAIVVLKLRRKRLAHKLGWYIEPNCFGPGLCVVHNGPVIVNGEARFGANCRIQAMVNIGASNNSKKAPVGGDLIYFGPGAKVFGDIKLGSNIAIGANAVVNKSFESDGITLGGVPAKIIAEHGCKEFVIDALAYVSNR